MSSTKIFAHDDNDVVSLNMLMQRRIQETKKSTIKNHNLDTKREKVDQCIQFAMSKTCHIDNDDNELHDSSVFRR